MAEPSSRCGAALGRAVGLLALAAAALLLLVLRDGGAGALQPEGSDAAVETSADVLEAPRHRDADRADAVEPSAPAAVRAADAPVGLFEHALTVELIDGDGRPLPGVNLWAGPPRHPLGHAGRSDQEGRVALRWRSREPSGELVIELRSGIHDVLGLVRVPTRAGSVARVAATLDRRVLGDPPQVDVYLDEENADPDGGSIVMETMFIEDARESVDERRRRRGFSQPEVLIEEDGLARFRAVEAVKRRGHQTLLSALYDTHHVDMMRLHGLEELLTALRDGGERCFVEGAVVDQFGAPMRSVLVRAEQTDLGFGVHARTGDDGAFRLEVPAGNLRVRAGAGADGAKARLTVGPGETVRWDAFLQRGAELAGRLVGADAAPLAGWRVVADAPLPGGLWIGATRTDEGGRFLLRELPATSVGLRVIPASAALALPVATLAGVDATRPLELAVGDVERTPAELMFVPLDEDADGPVAGELRVWQAGGRWGGRTALYGARGAPAKVPLAAGTYVLEVGAVGPSWTELGPVELAAGASHDLGAVSFEPRGTLAIDVQRGRRPEARSEPLAESDLMLRVVRLRADVESIAFDGPLARLGAARELRVPPGSYRVEWHGGGLRAGSAEARVAAGLVRRVYAVLERAPR